MGALDKLYGELFSLADEKYKKFNCSLIPGINTDTVIGVRMPVLRTLAKKYGGELIYDGYLESLPHTYYEENIIHGILLTKMRDFHECILAVNQFLPYINNWACCDLLSPKVFVKDQVMLYDYIKVWLYSEHEYTVRFGIKMLLDFFLDGNFIEEHLTIVAAIDREEYYIKMMAAWFFATALAKQWDAASKYIFEKRILDAWIHNKSIQKACESYRISADRKNILRKYKIKTKDICT